MLDELIGGAASTGSTRLVVVEGPAGIGKSSLMAAARQRAADAGMQVLGARGGQLEREFAFGVVRQLFEPALVDEKRREEVLAGAAAPAGSVLAPGEEGGTAVSGDSSFAALHGLYWLTANLSEEAPLLLAVDDLHWSDRPSLRFLAYLARRLEGLAVLLTCSQRPNEPGADRALLGELATNPLTALLQPAPLSEHAVAEVVRDRLGDDAEEPFIRACRSSTAGNPLLLDELIKAIRADGIHPVAGNAGLVIEVGPKAVSRAVLVRLERLGEVAVAVAHAVAVLADRAEPSAVAALAEVDERQAAHAIAALTGDELLGSALPLRFVHPLVRDAVYADIPPGERELHHARAAELLAETAAPAEQVAAHLLTTAPRGQPWVVETLRNAARSARQKGAAESAVSYLGRALAEPPPAESRATVQFELGIARMLAGKPDVELLEIAYESLRDPLVRAKTALVLGAALLVEGSAQEAAAIARRAAGELPAELEALRQRLEAFELCTVWFCGLESEALRRLERYRRPPADEGSGAKMLAAVAAGDWAYCAGPAEDCAELALQALKGGELIAADNGYLSIVPIDVLALADRDEALEWLDASMADAQRRGSSGAWFAIHVWLGWTLLRRGELTDAEDSLRSAVDEMAFWGLAAVSGLHGHAFLAYVLLERGDLEGARDILEQSGPPAGIFEAARLWLISRLELLIAEGRAQEAIKVAQQVEEGYPRVLNPAVGHWRSLKARALDQLGQRDEALRLAEEELELARRWGAPGTVGRSLRELGALERERGLDHLREAVAVLQGAPARLEHAKALAALGTALRHARRPADAREPLREALDLADRCGAMALAEQVRQELLASGARPRRFRRWGLDALTASELRVARLAAQGKRNREIAQSLFVTPKTVEVHLSRCYRKLDVSGRKGLAEALEAEDDEAASAGKT